MRTQRTIGRHHAVRVDEQLTGWRGWLVRLGGTLPQNTITLSARWIVSTTVVPAGSELERHEAGHLDQAAQYGRWYLPRYLLLNLVALVRAWRHWRRLRGGAIHRWHPMEIDANRRAGLPDDWGHAGG
jgi:hypothetical protein